MKVKEVKTINEKKTQCDITTENENFFVVCPESKKSVLVHNSPSVIAGINPENDRFFVATKSLFAKEPKINYTEEDIEANHGHAPGLVEKLKYALKYLPSIIFEGIYQGDFMYTKSDLRVRKDGDTSYIVFNPNTLIYAVPLGSSLGNKVQDSDMGIVFHTKYVGSSIAEMKATFSFAPLTSKDPSVIIFPATLPNMSGKVSLSAEEAHVIDGLLEQALDVYHSISPRLMSLFEDPSNTVGSLINIYKNKNIRDGAEDSGRGFIEFATAYIQKQRDEKKTEKGRAAVDEKYKDTLSVIEGSAMVAPEKHLDALFSFQKSLASIKKTFIQKLESINSEIKTFTAGEGETMNPSGGEGFVISSVEGSVVKLVDRNDFSKLNFLQGAFQKSKVEENVFKERLSPEDLKKVIIPLIKVEKDVKKLAKIYTSLKDTAGLKSALSDLLMDKFFTPSTRAMIVDLLLKAAESTDEEIFYQFMKGVVQYGIVPLTAGLIPFNMKERSMDGAVAIAKRIGISAEDALYIAEELFQNLFYFTPAKPARFGMGEVWLIICNASSKEPETGDINYKGTSLELKTSGGRLSGMAGDAAVNNGMVALTSFIEDILPRYFDAKTAKAIGAQIEANPLIMNPATTKSPFFDKLLQLLGTPAKQKAFCLEWAKTWTQKMTVTKKMKAIAAGSPYVGLLAQALRENDPDEILKRLGQFQLAMYQVAESIASFLFIKKSNTQALVVQNPEELATAIDKGLIAIRGYSFKDPNSRSVAVEIR